jgi:hypothetical protein
MFRNIRPGKLVSIRKEKRTMVAIVGVVFPVFGLILAALLMRNRQQYLLHQERMAALEKGTAIPLGPEPAPWSPRAYLLRGLIWSFGGVALIVCLLGISWSSQRPPSAVDESYRARALSQNLDIPLDQARRVVEKDQGRTGMPAGVALLGVVPLAVGLAYLVFYFTDDSRKQLAAEAHSESFGPRS